MGVGVSKGGDAVEYRGAVVCVCSRRQMSATSWRCENQKRVVARAHGSALARSFRTKGATHVYGMQIFAPSLSPPPPPPSSARHPLCWDWILPAHFWSFQVTFYVSLSLRPELKPFKIVMQNGNDPTIRVKRYSCIMRHHMVSYARRHTNNDGASRCSLF